MTEFKVAKINLDKERRLKLTLRGLNEFEQITGYSLVEIDDLSDLSPREFYVLLWACLIWEDKELKLEAITPLVEKANGVELMSAVLECISNSMPEAKPETAPLVVKKETAPVIESTGFNSGASAVTTSNSPKFLSGD
jgi:hypothetical protein